MGGWKLCLFVVSRLADYAICQTGLTNGGFRVKGGSNVIIRNLKLKNSPEGKDLIEIQKSTKVWVDHLDVSGK